MIHRSFCLVPLAACSLLWSVDLFSLVAFIACMVLMELWPIDLYDLLLSMAGSLWPDDLHKVCILIYVKHI